MGNMNCLKHYTEPRFNDIVPAIDGNLSASTVSGQELDPRSGPY